MSKFILMRHGQSMWNQQNLFTGWVNVPLSSVGVQEALEAAKILREIPIDHIFCSGLIRAQMTALLALSDHSSRKVPLFPKNYGPNHQGWGDIHAQAALDSIIPVTVAEELNERMYGELQGYNKQETIETYGEAQVKQWRRSYDLAPPKGESLKMTFERVIPYFTKEILPLLQAGKTVFLCAHGNSLRSLIMLIEEIPSEKIIGLEIATGSPIIYDFENNLFKKKVVRRSP